MEGGYKAWSAAGLRTKLEGADTPISILQEVRGKAIIPFLCAVVGASFAAADAS